MKRIVEVVSLGVALGLGSPLLADAQVEGPRPTQVLIRAEAKGGSLPQLQPANIKIEVGKSQLQLSSLRPLTGPGGEKVEVALLIDDGLRTNFGIQLQDIEKFVQTTVSPNVSIGVGFMRNGGAEFPQGFSNDPEVRGQGHPVADQLRRHLRQSILRYLRPDETLADAGERGTRNSYDYERHRLLQRLR